MRHECYSGLQSDLATLAEEFEVTLDRICTESIIGAAARNRPQMLAPFRLPLTLLFLAGSLSLSEAQSPLPICERAVGKLKSDSTLAGAMKAAFGDLGTSHDEDCLYPLQVLRYPDVDVLLTQNLAPEDACHGCVADLSATVLRRVPDGFKRIKTFEAFGKSGTFGSISSAAPIAIGGDDGLAIEAGGTFQGYTYETLDLYAFRRQGFVHLDSGSGPLYIFGDNGGAQTDQGKSLSISSAWSLDTNGELVVDYKVSDTRGSRQARVVWTVGQTQLSLKSGEIPKEMAHAIGAE
jgi:hypothetical protein